VIEPANFTEEHLTDNQEFVIILGDILQDYILIEAKKLETTRKRHSEELDFQ
jgi:uracil-DNA glycosylase